jgi:hypothetical protein
LQAHIIQSPEITEVFAYPPDDNIASNQSFPSSLPSGNVGAGALLVRASLIFATFA